MIFIASAAATLFGFALGYWAAWMHNHPRRCPVCAWRAGAYDGLSEAMRGKQGYAVGPYTASEIVEMGKRP